MGALLALAVVLAFTVLTTKYVTDFALHRKMLDIPNYRSSHSNPTPRGGGISVVAAFQLTLIIGWASGHISTEIALVLASGTLVAVVGYFDDRFGLRVRWRLLSHATAATWLLASVVPISPLQMPGGLYSAGWVGVILCFLWIVWFLNLYNFMDGIDGLATVEAVSVSGGAALIVMSSGDGQLAFVIAALGASALGFLYWNWPPAVVFLGDVGSGFLGFTFAALSIITHNNGTMTIWSWGILSGLFVVDATVTLICRLFVGKRVYEAHRTHAYQHASQELGRHLPVTLVAGAINVFWLLPLAYLGTIRPMIGLYLVLVAWAPLIFLCFRYRAGLPTEGPAG